MSSLCRDWVNLQSYFKGMNMYIHFSLSIYFITKYIVASDYLQSSRDFGICAVSWWYICDQKLLSSIPFGVDMFSVLLISSLKSFPKRTRNLELLKQVGLWRELSGGSYLISDPEILLFSIRQRIVLFRGSFYNTYRMIVDQKIHNKNFIFTI